MITNFNVRQAYHRFQPAAWILAEGEDAHEFLQSQFSNDLNQLQVGESQYGLWLDVKGKVQADSFVLRSGEESYYLMSYFSPGEAIVDKLNGFVVADDVDFSNLAQEVTGISVMGDPAAVAKVLGNDNGAGVVSFGDAELYLLPGRRSRSGSLEIIGNKSSVSELEQTLQKTVSGIVDLDSSYMERLRISELIPAIPQDIGPGELPQEGALEEDAISFSKGCYLGQEVMSRLHSMGRVRRSLRLAQSENFTESGCELWAEERKAGILKSTVQMEQGFLHLVLVSNVLAGTDTLIARSKGGNHTLKLLK